MSRLLVAALLVGSCTRKAPTASVAEQTTKPAAVAKAELPKPTESAQSDATAAEVSAIAGSVNVLAMSLYGQLRAPKGNVFFSPYSISTALAMTYGGARGNTAAEMRKTLHLSLAEPRLHAAEASLARKLRSREGYALHVANALWPARGCGVLPEYSAMTRRHYGAYVQEVDFGNEESARATINHWVEEQTQDKIKNLIPEGILNPLIRLVITNAIHFKGDWAAKFDKSQTEREPFYLLEGNRVRAPTMIQTGRFRTGIADDVKLLELDYAGGDLSMLIVLPKERTGLPAVEESLSVTSIRKWRETLKKRTIEVHLPRFKIEASCSLDKQLKTLGMRDAFSKRAADFSGMSREPLYIYKVLHKAFVEVNEKGTKAAAATAVIMKAKSISRDEPPVPEFRADHPFLFLIRDNNSGSILFLGRLMNPKA